MLKEFASFHNHSHFSVFDGLSLPEELLKAAKEKGLKSIALTDHGVTHGHADWYLMGKKMGVKTVFGVEAYVIHDLKEWKALKGEIDSQKRKGAKKEDNEYTADGDVVDPKALRRKGHLVILASNREGLSNLYQLTFKAHKFGFYQKPRMDKVMLQEHAKGLIATSACMGGVISKRLWDLKEGSCTWEDVKNEVLDYDRIFGRGRFYLELQFNEMDKEQNYINTSLVQLHKETGVPLTVTTDSHYATQAEWEPRELLHLMGWSKKTVADLPEQKLDSQVKQLFVKSPEEMWLTYEKLAGHCIDPKTAMEAFQGTLLIDSLIEDFEPDTHQRLPTLPFANPYKEMGMRAIAGLKKLGLAENEIYKDRLLFELGVIKQKGISNYFLVCQQIIEEAKKYMLVGPGRGSAAGSLVCWCLGITDLDPIKRDLLFERFLDIDRAELPDIDTDFEDPKAAKRMLQKMFGDDNVASLSSYGTFQIKGLLKDLGRVYGVDHNLINKLNRQIDKELKVLYVDQDKSTLVVKLDDIIRVSPSFNTFVEENPDLGSKIKTLYGRIRHVTRHAAGVIIGDNLPAETSCFVAKAKGKKTKDNEDGEDDTLAEEGEMVVQCSFTEGIVNKNLSAMGFVKMDILGLANLRVIRCALEHISSRTGKSFDELYEGLRSHNMDLDDIKVMKNIFWDGNFGAIFQFSNPGIRALAKRVKPDSFVDVSAICSLYRPGPLKGGYDKVYVTAKHGEIASLGHPVLDEILGSTKGCLVFQEQLMKVCSVFGKMTGKEVNRVRKVLLKKDKSKTEEFLKQENDVLYASFHKGCMEHGFPEDKTLKLWEDIKAFGGYAFNKSHSDAYSLTTMQTAHLATYYPLEFYTAALTKAQANAIQTLVADIQKTGIKILPVDINKSRAANIIEGLCIRLALGRVLGVGPSVIEKIVANQPYTSFQDFLDRSKANKTAVEALIQVGAFGSLPGCGNIKRLWEAYRKWTDNVLVTLDGELKIVDEKVSGGPKLARVQSVKGRPRWDELYSRIMTDEKIEDFKLHEKVFLENELMEFSLAGTPFEILDRKKKITAMFDGVVSTMEEFLGGEEEMTMLPVVVKEWKEKPQRNGQMFAFIKFATEDGETFDVPAFANMWKWISPVIRKGSVYIATFNRDIDDDPERLKLGRPGWAQSQHSTMQAFINVDDISL
jgi:DNA polymerase-3 subunit alpha